MLANKLGGGARKQAPPSKKVLSQEWTQQFQNQDPNRRADDQVVDTRNNGLGKSPSTHMLNGGDNAGQATRCELPSAVHIAQISSSDEDYLDFEEADDFEMEDEAA